MKVTSFRVASTSGKNKKPGSGDASFDDGKSYGWSVDPTDGSFTFFGHRKILCSSQQFRINSPKRAAALAAVLYC